MKSNIRSAASLAASLTLLCTLSAQAQQPTPAPSAPAVEVPAMNCETPGSAPIDSAGTAMTRFQKKVDDYKVCVNKYAASTGAKANEYAAQSRAWASAANKAIEDYNAYVTALNESQKGK